jgi:hypothetical protein
VTGTHGVSVVAIVASAGTFPEDVDGQRASPGHNAIDALDDVLRNE